MYSFFRRRQVQRSRCRSRTPPEPIINTYICVLYKVKKNESVTFEFKKMAKSTIFYETYCKVLIDPERAKLPYACTIIIVCFMLFFMFIVFLTY